MTFQRPHQRYGEENLPHTHKHKLVTGVMALK